MVAAALALVVPMWAGTRLDRLLREVRGS